MEQGNDQHDYPVAISDQFRKRGRSTLVMTKIGGVLSILLGLVGGGGLIAMILMSGGSGIPDGAWIGMAVSIVLFAVIAVLGLRLLIRPHPHRDFLTAEHAFVITHDSIEFPARPGLDAQSWPLDELTVFTDGVHLVLDHDDLGSRRFRNIEIKEPLADLADRIERAQRRIRYQDRPTTDVGMIDLVEEPE